MEHNIGCCGEGVIRRGTGGYGYKCVRTAQRWLAVMDHLRMSWMERGTVGFGGGVQSVHSRLMAGSTRWRVICIHDVWCSLFRGFGGIHEACSGLGGFTRLAVACGFHGVWHRYFLEFNCLGFVCALLFRCQGWTRTCTESGRLCIGKEEVKTAALLSGSDRWVCHRHGACQGFAPGVVLMRVQISALAVMDRL
jgi:hypothetical protein